MQLGRGDSDMKMTGFEPKEKYESLVLFKLGTSQGRKYIYCIDTDEIPGFILLLKNHIFIVRSEDTIFIFHV